MLRRAFLASTLLLQLAVSPAGAVLRADPSEAQSFSAPSVQPADVQAAIAAQAAQDAQTYTTPSQATAAAQNVVATNLSGPINMAAGSTVGGQPIARTSDLSGLLPSATAASTYQPLGSYATTSALTSATSGLLSASSAAAAYQPLGNYASASALSALSSSVVMSVGGVAPVAGNVPLSLASVGNVASVTYLHHYPTASMTVPAVGLGAIGTGTITIAGTASSPVPAPGDLCVISPTAATNALSYMIGTGWVTTNGTIKVALEAGTLVAISAGTLGVNVLCMQ